VPIQGGRVLLVDRAAGAEVVGHAREHGAAGVVGVAAVVVTGTAVMTAGPAAPATRMRDAREKRRARRRTIAVFDDGRGG
jgi:hypothetical protein